MSGVFSLRASQAVNTATSGNAIAQSTLELYGLSTNPFHHDELPFFPAKQHKALLDKSVHLACFTELMLLVSGASGMGKTAFTKAFIARLGEDVQIIEQNVTLLMSERDIIECLCTALEISMPDGVDQQETIKRLHQKFLEKAEQVDQPSIVIFDNADQMSESALDFLEVFNMQKHENSVHFVLVGNEQLVDYYSQHHGAAIQHNMFVLELEPFSYEDIDAYIDARFIAGGVEGGHPFSDKEIKYLHSQSCGIPAILNQSVVARINQARTQVVKRTFGGLPVFHFATIACVVGVLSVAYWANGRVETVSPETDVADVEVVDVLDQVAKRLDAHKAERVAKALALEAAGQLAVESEVVEGSDLSLLTEPEVITETLSLNEVQTEDVEDSRAVTAADTQVSVIIEGSGVKQVDVPVQQVFVSDAKKAIENKQKDDAQLALVEKTNDEQVAGVEEVKVVVAQPITIEPSKKVGQRALETFAPNDYTLQVFGSHDEVKVKHFVASNQSTGNLRYFETEHEGKRWFVVVFGRYDDRESAMGAIDTLAAPIKDQRPWARPLKGLVSN